MHFDTNGQTLFDTCVLLSKDEHCGVTLFYHTLLGHACAMLLLDSQFILGKLLDTFSMGTLVGHSCGTLLRRPLAGTAVGYSCGTLLSTFAGYSCVTLR